MKQPFRILVTAGAAVVGATALMAQAPAPGQPSGAAPAPTIALAVPPKHLVVAREPGRYGGWPANHGVWAWGTKSSSASAGDT